MKIYEIKLYCEICDKVRKYKLIRKDKNLYQCEVCGNVIQYTEPKEIKIRAILSTGSISTQGSVTVKETSVISVGDEIVIDTKDGPKLGKVTSVELKDGRRVEEGQAKDISTLWLKNIEEVIVRVSLHRGPVTTSYRFTTSGNTKFRVGEVIVIDGRKYKINRIKLDNGVLKRDGEMAFAKDIKRLYAISVDKLR